MPTATSFACGCDAGFFWDALTETCEDPCDPDPCALIADATAGSCNGLDADDFTCGCDADFFWDGDTDTCEDPCDPDPCETIDNADAGTCTGIDVDDFTCDCESGYAWDEVTDTCAGPCDPDPCGDIPNATPDSCADLGEGEFTCECDFGFIWEDETDACDVNACEPDPCEEIENTVPESCSPVEEDAFQCDCVSGLGWESVRMRCTSCENYRDCLLDCSPLNINFNFCLTSCNNEFDLDCDCEFGLQNPDYLSCQTQCNHADRPAPTLAVLGQLFLRRLPCRRGTLIPRAASVQFCRPDNGCCRSLRGRRYDLPGDAAPLVIQAVGKRILEDLQEQKGLPGDPL